MARFARISMNCEITSVSGSNARPISRQIQLIPGLLLYADTSPKS